MIDQCVRSQRSDSSGQWWSKVWLVGELIGKTLKDVRKEEGTISLVRCFVESRIWKEDS